MMNQETPPKYHRMAALKTVDQFRSYCQALGIDIPLDEEVLPGEANPLAQAALLSNGRRIGNRFCIQPMEGWDGTPDGKPGEDTFRRWRNFGASGAKLIWGGEAAAVLHEGRANPNQLLVCYANAPHLERLRQALVERHRQDFGRTDDLLVGLQLTHSGRFCRPNDRRLEPHILYHHPVLDRLFGTQVTPVLTDGEIDGLIGCYVDAARIAQQIGFDFVDVKHCHGYLGHEFLSAVSRPGIYGGSLENRTRFLREVVRGIQAAAPGLMIGVRLSLFDFPAFRSDEHGATVMLAERDADGSYPFRFGADPRDPTRLCLDEPFALLRMLQEMDVELVNLTAGSPYYNPHIQRPAFFPPSDGYRLVEDPLAGVARLIAATAQVKAAFPDLWIVGSGYSYLQEWLPQVAQAVVRAGQADFIGLGRMVLSYPEMPADILAGRELDRRRICRTFSDCTTAPRRGLVSGCYPLDDHYRAMPQAAQLKNTKVNK